MHSGLQESDTKSSISKAVFNKAEKRFQLRIKWKKVIKYGFLCLKKLCINFVKFMHIQILTNFKKFDKILKKLCMSKFLYKGHKNNKFFIQIFWIYFAKILYTFCITFSYKP